MNDAGATWIQRCECGLPPPSYMCAISMETKADGAKCVELADSAGQWCKPADRATDSLPIPLMIFTGVVSCLVIGWLIGKRKAPR